MRTTTVTVHMAASLDGFIARKDGRVDWMETADRFEPGEELDPQYVADFLKSIDCYVMGSRTYETALGFVQSGHGWAYDDKPVMVLTRRELPQAVPTVEFRSGGGPRVARRLCPSGRPAMLAAQNKKGVPMSRSIRLAFIAVAATTLAAATLPAMSAAPGATAGVHVGTPEDRAAIEKLMWTYDRMLDTYDADAYAKLFTPDGAFGQTKGREALHKMIADLKKGHDERRAKGEKISMRHFTMNQYLEFTGPTTARYHYYHQTIFGTGGEKSPEPARIAAAGNGVDDLVKIDGQWFIKFRNVAAADDK